MPLTIARTAFESVDGYGVVDLPGAATVVGPVRCARKVLERTTIDLVRHATYALAVHGLDGCGGAAALNHERGDDTTAVFDLYATELSEWASNTGFRPVTGIGVGLVELDLHGPDVEAANVASALASAGRLTGSRVVIHGVAEDDAIPVALDAAGSNSVRFEHDLASALAVDCDVLFVRVATGAIDHEVAANASADRIISLAPLATTARGLAVASRMGSTVVPDFVSAGGQYLAAMGVDDIAGTTASTVARFAGAGIDSFVMACELAESHLRTWASDLPFGRPLAP